MIKSRRSRELATNLSGVIRADYDVPKVAQKLNALNIASHLLIPLIIMKSILVKIDNESLNYALPLLLE